MKIDVGTSYYPENWDRERIIRDADLMKLAGLRYVRMGEFAWSHLEPTEGNYQLDWLEEAVQIFGERGILSVLCTPSSAAPAWMCKKYPSILRIYRDDTKAWFGFRDHTCYTSKIYRKFITAITLQLVERFKNNPFVAAWQIDNEPGSSRFPECFCDDCQNEFRRYIKDKYQTLDALNKAWKTPFWSGEYSDWDELELSGIDDRTYACKTLESRRFRSRVQADFILFQAAIIRERMPGLPIGTNNYCVADRYEVFADLDFAGNDLYPNYLAENKMMAAYYHKLRTMVYFGLKPGVAPWIMETPPNPGWPMKDLTKFFFWFYFAMGNDKIFYFPWGNAPSGEEKIHLSVVNAYGKPGMIYDAFSKMVAEADQVLAPYKTLPPPHSHYAILRDHDAEWVYAGGVIPSMKDYYASFECSYISLCRTGDYAEIIPQSADWSAYKLIVMSIQTHISKSLAEKMRSFVQNGGVIVMNGMSGCFDGCGCHVDGILPEHVHDLFGVEIGENKPCRAEDPVWQDTPDFERRKPIVGGILDGEKVRGTLSLWTAELLPSTAETVLAFENSQLAGLPFCTVNSYGKGYAIYYGADRIDQNLCDKIIRFAAKKAGLTPVVYPENVAVIKRGNLAFAFNFGDDPVSFSAGFSGKNILGNALNGEILTLPPQESAVIEISETAL